MIYDINRYRIPIPEQDDASLERDILESGVIDPLGLYLIPGFAQSELGFDPAELQKQLETRYPVRGEGDEIEPAVPQWVTGGNAALRYRGNELKRGKMWFQRDSTDRFFRRYGYTGWQWDVLPATASVETCRELEPVADAYDRWVGKLEGGFPKANHYIVTKYEDGQHNIGFHSDKVADIAPGSLITIVKTGAHGRPFELCLPGEEKRPFFSEVLAPGTAVVMTIDANLRTKHGVPVVDDEAMGSSGSIVFRTIATMIDRDEALRGQERAQRNRERAAERRAAREAQA